jgi:WhiB family transcriptional regulator, redox-sensing transcriptional regulator
VRLYTPASMDASERLRKGEPVASNEEWQDLGACRRAPVELFFPPAEQEADEAKEICATCAVRQPCLEAALVAGERFGIWGGLNTQERRSLAARRRRSAAAAARQALSEAPDVEPIPG